MEERYDSVITEHDDSIEVLDNIETPRSSIRAPARMPYSMVVIIGDKTHIFNDEDRIKKFYRRVTRDDSDLTLQEFALPLASSAMYTPNGFSLSTGSYRRRELSTSRGTKLTIYSKYKDEMDKVMHSYLRLNEEKVVV